jgi:hypothetical protein
MRYVLQENIYNEEGFERLKSALDRLGLEYSEHKVIPFVGELEPVPVLDTGNVICFGSYSMRNIAKQNGWYPGVFDIENFDFTKQLAVWGDCMLNADSKVCCFMKALIAANLMGELDEFFIRPINDSKAFSGRKITYDEMNDWIAQVASLDDYGSTLTPDTLIQVAPLKKIFSEWRCWIVKGELITASCYKLGNQVTYKWDVPNNILSFASEQAYRAHIGDQDPADAYVMDVADTPAGLKIVEVNTLNAAGFYNGDMVKLVIALESKFNRAMEN